MISDHKLLELGWDLIWNDLTRQKTLSDHPLGIGVENYDLNKLPSESKLPHLFWIKDSNLRNLKIEIDHADQFLYLWLRLKREDKPEFITPFRRLSLHLHKSLSIFSFEFEGADTSKADGEFNTFDDQTIFSSVLFKDRIEDIIRARDSREGMNYAIIIVESDSDLDFRVRKEGGKKIGFLHLFSQKQKPG